MAVTLTAAQKAAAVAAAAQAATTAAMQAALTNLYAIRDSGTQRSLTKLGEVEFEKWYRSDTELLAAIGSLERRLGIQRVTNIVVHGHKGWSRRDDR